MLDQSPRELLSLFSLSRLHLTGQVGWFLSKTKFIKIWCILNSLGRWMFDHFRDRRSLDGRTFLYIRYVLKKCEHVNIILWVKARHVDWIYVGFSLKIWSELSVLEVNILCCTSLWAAMHNICPIWGYCSFPHEWKCGKFIIKHRVKLRWDMTSCYIYNQSYLSCMKWWVTKIDPFTRYFFPLG